jgi:hypothetical protein
VTSLAGPLIRNGRDVSLNPATGLAPSDIRSMVRSLVICLTHASRTLYFSSSSLLTIFPSLKGVK